MSEQKVETFELPVDDKGVPYIPDTLLSRFMPVVDRLVKPRLDQVREEARKEFSGRVADPLEKEKFKTLEEENHRYKVEDAERQKRYDEAEKLRETREKQRLDEHNKELETKQQEITRRDARLRQMASGDIKIAAKRFGARDESLSELAEILGKYIDLDENLQPFVKKDQPFIEEMLGKEAAGKTVTIEGLVKAYLDKNTHHRAGTGGTGGGARGGASFNGADPTEVEKAEQAYKDAQTKYRKTHDTMRDLPAVQAAKLHLDKVKTGTATK